MNSKLRNMVDETLGNESSNSFKERKREMLLKDTKGSQMQYAKKETWRKRNEEIINT